MLYLLVVNYHTAELIQQLLQSATQGTHRPPVIVVNNRPDDPGIPALAAKPALTVLEPGQNLGFGEGCNVGLRYLYDRNPDAWVWLINPDTTLTAGAIAQVIAAFTAHSDIAILGTQVQDTTGQLWFEQGWFNPWLGSMTYINSAERRLRADSLPDTPNIRASQWVSGCSLVVNCAQFDACPSFDAHLFLYYEDTEFCLRYGKQGQSVAVLSAPIVVHRVSSATSRYPTAKFAHATFSKLYVLHRHGTVLALGLNLVYLLAQSFAGRVTGNSARAAGRWLGVKQFLAFWQTGQKPPLPARLTALQPPSPVPASPAPSPSEPPPLTHDPAVQAHAG